MSRVRAFRSPYCAEAREPGSGGRCAIISRVAGERHEPRLPSFLNRYVCGQLESGMTAGFGGAVSSKAGPCQVLWKPEHSALVAVSED
jgi:hypothetical protein